MTKQIQPCPFCGTPGVHNHSNGWHGVGCMTPRCPGLRSGLYHRSQDDAVEAWHRRVTSAPALQDTQAGWSTEHHIALREAYEIKAENDYFDARPSRDSEPSRELFDAGFRRGFDAAAALLSAATPARQALADEQQKERADALLDGFDSRIETAKMNGDQYDAGYLTAMRAMFCELLTVAGIGGKGGAA